MTDTAIKMCKCGLPAANVTLEGTEFTGCSHCDTVSCSLDPKTCEQCNTLEDKSSDSGFYGYDVLE